MMKNKLLVIIPLVLFTILAIILGVSYIAQQKSRNPGPKFATQNTNNENNSNTASGIIWGFNGTNWVNTDAKPSNCPTSLVLQSPVDLTKVTSVLYPGQVRGGNYKPHGGFRFDNSDNSIQIRLPIDGYIYSGSSYIEMGQRQYMVDIINNCGYMIRFDHISRLSPELEVLFKSEIPNNGEGDSRTTKFNTLKLFNAGDLIATEIGFKSPKNVGVDFGVYDLNSVNEVSKDANWSSKYKMFAEKAFYGICWLDYMNSEDKKLVYSLPGAGTEGKVSDYCN